MRVLRLGNKSYRKKPEIKDTGDRYTKKDLERCKLQDFEKWFPGIGVYTRVNPIEILSFDNPNLDTVPDNVPPANVFPNIVATPNTTDIRATNTYYWSPERHIYTKEDK